MNRPPGDDDDILRQVSDALRALGLRDPSADGVLTGLRDALRKLVDDRTDDQPSIVVLGSDRRTPEGPDLRVVDTEEAERIQQASAPEDQVQVRVFRAAHLASDEPRGVISGQGAILARYIDGERPWQTVYRGESARPYRLACDAGQLELAVDGSTVERMTPGQTVDVEARTIRVRAASSGDATGRYVRL